MCGIIGYVGLSSAQPILLNGLKKLEYRGYDSAGVAVHNRQKINIIKSQIHWLDMTNLISKSNQLVT